MLDRSAHSAKARLALTAGILAAVSYPAAVQAQPATIPLSGIVRDFEKSHADFDLASASGHYAGNIASSLDANSKPVFGGGGYRVASQWRDASARQIPPQLFNVLTPSCSGSGAGIVVNNVVDIINQGRVDSYDSSIGPYGGANVHSLAKVWTNTVVPDSVNVTNNSDVFGDLLIGPGGNLATVINMSPNSDIWGTTGTMAAVVPMPVLFEPNIGASVGNRVYNTSGVQILSSNLHCNELTIQGGAVVRISGNVTIVADGQVQIAGGRLEVPPGSTLKLYVKYRAFFSSAGNGSPHDPSATRVYLLASNFVRVSNNVPGQLHAQVYAPIGELQIDQSAQFHGTFVGRTLSVGNQGKFRMDESLSALAGAVTDTAGTQGAAGSGGITSAATFAQWFTDVPGFNQSKVHTIMLQRVAGVYEYVNDQFHPIDNLLLGNEGQAHNYNVTYEAAADFTYESCAGQFVEFRGSDDFWLAVDGSIAMDLGGTGANTAQYLELDRLGLVDGQTYRLIFFYAQRQAVAVPSIFRLRTNLVLSPVAAQQTITASWD